MKRLSRDFGILTPFVAALVILAGARASLWQRLWLLLGLGGVLLAYAGAMLVRAVRARSLLGERLQYEAMHDSLTSLPNRRYFMQWAERALAGAVTPAAT